VLLFGRNIVYFFYKYRLFFFYYTNNCIEIPGYSSRLFLLAFFFFSFGAFFSINKKNIVISLQKYQIIWLVAALIRMFLSVYLSGTAYNKFYFPKKNRLFTESKLIKEGF